MVTLVPFLSYVLLFHAVVIRSYPCSMLLLLSVLISFPSLPSPSFPSLVLSSRLLLHPPSAVLLSSLRPPPSLHRRPPPPRRGLVEPQAAAVEVEPQVFQEGELPPALYANRKTKQGQGCSSTRPTFQASLWFQAAFDGPFLAPVLQPLVCWAPTLCGRAAPTRAQTRMRTDKSCSHAGMRHTDGVDASCSAMRGACAALPFNVYFYSAVILQPATRNTCAI